MCRCGHMQILHLKFAHLHICTLTLLLRIAQILQQFNFQHNKQDAYKRRGGNIFIPGMLKAPVANGYANKYANGIKYVKR